jgi:hypothetical protein
VATARELVRAVAEATGVPEGTVIVHDRNLLLGGLRTAGKRGRGVAHVTWTDAANLLIAVAGSQNVKDSVKTVIQHGRRLPTMPGRRGRLAIPKTKSDLSVPELLQLPEKHTFAQTLAALIDAAASGSLRSVVDAGVLEEIQVHLRTHSPVDEIDIGYKGNVERYFYRDFEKDPNAPVPPDLTHIATFTQRTIVRLGNLLKGNISE